MSKKPHITVSVILCTHNGERSLSRTLEALRNQGMQEAFEIIVVDNGSTDSTHDIIRQFVDSTPHFVHCHEPRLGLSFARNRGVSEARGEIIAFTDDDALPVKDWVSRIYAHFRNSNGTTSVLGGPVAPLWEAAPPAWLTVRLKRSLALVDWGTEKKTLSDKEWLAGVNMSYPKTVLTAEGGFSTNLGRLGTRLVSMEEIAMITGIRNSGGTIFYDPKILVYHRINESRLNRAWFLKRFYWQGWSEALWNGHQNNAMHWQPLLRRSISRLFRTMNDYRRLSSGIAGREGKKRTKNAGQITTENKVTPFEALCFMCRDIGYLRALSKS